MSNTIITHSGRFHTDEVSAIALLELLFGEKATVYRTRDLNLIKELSGSNTAYVVDVGEVYDPLNRRFDHHQETMDMSFFELRGKGRPSKKCKIPVSSLGLVYHTYGCDLIRALVAKRELDTELSFWEIEDLYSRLYTVLCRDIDANDNAVPIVGRGVQLNYLPNMSLIAIVSSFNSEDHDSPAQDLAFRQAVNFVSIAFSQILESHISMFLTKKHVRDNLTDFTITPEEAFKLIMKGHGQEVSIPEAPPSLKELFEHIIVFRDPLPAKQILNEIDRENKWKFIITRKNDDQWKITTRTLPGRVTLIPLIGEQEAKRLFDDVTFVHKARFCGEAQSLRTALKMCECSFKEHIYGARHNYNYEKA